MTIQIAKVEDIPDLVTFSRHLHQHTQYSKFAFSADKVSEGFRNVITGDPKEGVVLIAKRDGRSIGTIGATAVEPHYSTDRIAAEWIWWVDRGESPRLLFTLLDGIEYWAKNIAKCKALQIGRATTTDTSRNFEKRGYACAERSYIKEL